MYGSVSFVAVTKTHMGKAHAEGAQHFICLSRQGDLDEHQEHSLFIVGNVIRT